MGKLLGVNEFAKYKGMSVYAVYKWIRTGILDATSISKAKNSKYLIDPDDFEEAIKRLKEVNNKTENTPEPEADLGGLGIEEFGEFVMEKLSAHKKTVIESAPENNGFDYNEEADDL